MVTEVLPEELVVPHVVPLRETAEGLDRSDRQVRKVLLSPIILLVIRQPVLKDFQRISQIRQFLFVPRDLQRSFRAVDEARDYVILITDIATIQSLQRIQRFLLVLETHPSCHFLLLGGFRLRHSNLYICGKIVSS